jgi:hypothetical protein
MYFLATSLYFGLFFRRRSFKVQVHRLFFHEEGLQAYMAQESTYNFPKGCGEWETEGVRRLDYDVKKYEAENTG